MRPNLISKEGRTTFHYGEQAVLTCEAGYKLEKRKTLTCLQSGNWNEQLPYCKGLFMKFKNNN